MLSSLAPGTPFKTFDCSKTETQSNHMGCMMSINAETLKASISHLSKNLFKWSRDTKGNCKAGLVFFHVDKLISGHFPVEQVKGKVIERRVKMNVMEKKILIDGECINFETKCNLKLKMVIRESIKRT